MPGGAREGAGRKPGSRGRRTQEVIDAAGEGLSPIAYMLAILRDQNQSADNRAWAAEKAAPYVHPKPAPEPRTVTIDLPDTSTAQGVKSAGACLIAAVAAGEIAPSEAASISALIEGQRKTIETADVLSRLEAIEEALNLAGKGRSAA